MKLFETYSSTLSNITYFRTVLFSYAQLKGMKISEGILNLAASSKKWTESLTLNISTYKKKYLGLVIQFSFFFEDWAKLKTPSEIFPPLPTAKTTTGGTVACYTKSPVKIFIPPEDVTKTTNNKVTCAW